MAEVVKARAHAHAKALAHAHRKAHGRAHAKAHGGNMGKPTGQVTRLGTGHGVDISAVIAQVIVLNLSY